MDKQDAFAEILKSATRQLELKRDQLRPLLERSRELQETMISLLENNKRLKKEEEWLLQNRFNLPIHMLKDKTRQLKLARQELHVKVKEVEKENEIIRWELNFICSP